MNIIYPVSRPWFDEREAAAVTRVMRSGWLTQGEEVEWFEQQLASYLGVPHVVACSTGTAALHLTLAALKLGPGDEVLVPDLTYVACANAVRYVGATPVLVDVNPQTWTIDIDHAKFLMTARTRAIMPVHLYGVACDMHKIMAFASHNGLVVIEDASESLGGSWEGQPTGTWGDFGTFSFYANKVMTTGEGGAIVVRGDYMADVLRSLRGQAQSTKQRFFHGEVGYNYRMTELQAAIGRVQLEKLPLLLEERTRVMQQYEQLLGGTLESPILPHSAPWLYTGLMPRIYAGGVRPYLEERGIESRPMFMPMHRLPMYAKPDREFPVSTRIWPRGISLPTYPTLSNTGVQYIAAALKELL